MAELRIGVEKPNNSIIYGASILSIILALITARKNLPLSNFFGLWAPTIMSFGILFKENELLERTKHAPL